MDYFQATERYRKRELKNQISLVVRIVILGIAIWLGWFWGYSQGDAVLASNAKHVLELTQSNNELQQNIATLTTQLRDETERRRKAELLSGKISDPSTQRLDEMIARYISKGIEADQIRLALQGIARPFKCRSVERHEAAVATGYFAGSEANAELLDGFIQVFVGGEAGQATGRDGLLFDSAKPITMRFAYLGGEKTVSGLLPLETTLIADTWLIKVTADTATLQGYVKLDIQKCNLG